MTQHDSRVTVHMLASLDGFVARKDGRVDWLETQDTYAGGETLTAAAVDAFLGSIDCYVMGARTYETALGFEAKGLGWAYGDKPTFVLTHRTLPKTRENIQFVAGDLSVLINEQLRPRFRGIWVVGGGDVCGACLQLGLVDEVRYSMAPVLIGEGLRFFERLTRDVPLHLVEAKAYDNAIVALRYDVKR